MTWTDIAVLAGVIAVGIAFVAVLVAVSVWPEMQGRDDE